jgi:hypothetical protein
MILSNLFSSKNLNTDSKAIISFENNLLLYSISLFIFVSYLYVKSVE